VKQVARVDALLDDRGDARIISEAHRTDILVPDANVRHNVERNTCSWVEGGLNFVNFDFLDRLVHEMLRVRVPLLLRFLPSFEVGSFASFRKRRVGLAVPFVKGTRIIILGQNLLARTVLATF